MKNVIVHWSYLFTFVFLILECRAREDELVSVDSVLNKFINNITRMNLNLLHSIRDAHKTIGDMDTDEIVELDNERTEIGNQQNHEKDINFIHTLLNDKSGSIETITFNPKSRQNSLDLLRNPLQIHKRTIPGTRINQEKSDKQKNIRTKQFNDIWKMLPLKLNSLTKNYDASSRSSKEERKPLIIVLTNSKKRDNAEKYRSSNKEIEFNGKIKEFLRDGCVTCVQAQVKRCYKALKECTKKTCSTYNCKSSFKKAFKTNSKKGCIAEFWKEEDSKIGSKRNVSAVIYVNHPDTPPQNYRSARSIGVNLSCEDDQDIVYPRSIEELLSQMTPKIGHGNANILRNKYDKACKKAVAKKCNKVCVAVITETCASHKCMKKQIKSLKKDCKKSCAVVFDVPKSSESSESSEEDEDDDENESD